MPTPTPPAQLREILLDAETIRARVDELGRAITEDYRADSPPVLVGILKGAVIFLSDLCRRIDLPVELETMAVSSYGASTKSSGVVRILKDLDGDVTGRHVILVEDIVDTGRTLDYLCRAFAERGPASVRTCALLDKPSRREVDVQVDYIGFEIPDRFVVGYGLDFDGRFRNLDAIGVLNPS